MHSSFQGDLPKDMIHQTTFPDWESLTLRVSEDYIALDVTGDWLTQEDTIPVHGDGTLTVYGSERYCELRKENGQWQRTDWAQADTIVVIYRVDILDQHTRLEGRNSQQQALRLVIAPGDLHWAIDETGA